MQPQTDQHARIVAAAEAVAGRGENPTLTAVRTELGGGSFSTISPVLRTWKAAQTHDDEPMREPLPARLHEAAIAGAGEIWRAALELAGERLAAERAALDATRVELDDAVTEATATADELATQLEQAQSTAQAATETAAQTEAELRGTLHAEHSQRAEAQQRFAVAQALADERQRELETARTQAQTIAQALADEHQREIETARTQAQAAAEQAQSTAQAAAETAAQTEAELRGTLHAEHSQRAEAHQRCAVAQALADERQRELETARTQAQAIAERASAAEALAEARQAEIERGQILHRELLARLEPVPDTTPVARPEKT